jgi:hypothetical protein
VELKLVTRETAIPPIVGSVCVCVGGGWLPPGAPLDIEASVPGLVQYTMCAANQTMTVYLVKSGTGKPRFTR